MSNIVVHLMHPNDGLPYCWEIGMGRPAAMSSDEDKVTCEECYYQSLWRLIPDFPNYEISKYGVVRNTNTGQEIAFHQSSTNVVQVTLYSTKTKRSTSRSIAKLLREVFGIEKTNQELISIFNLKPYGKRVG